MERDCWGLPTVQGNDEMARPASRTHKAAQRGRALSRKPQCWCPAVNNL